MATLAIPSFQDILDQYLSDYVSITTQQGFNVSVAPSTEIYARAYTTAQSVSMIYYLAQQANQANLVGTATGTDLDNLANLRNIFRKGAAPAQGFCAFNTASPQLIASGSLLTGPNSLQYQVSQSGVYSNNQQIPISCLTAGAVSNLEIGSSLTWATAPFNSQSTMLAATPITGGSDPETDTSLRARLLAVIQYPMQGGNASYLANLGSTLDPIIQQCFVYGNFNGAGTLLFVLTGNQTTSYIGRDIPHLLSDNYINGVLQAGLVPDPTTTTPYNQFSYDPYTSPLYNALQNTGNNLSNDTNILLGQLPLNLGNPFASVVTTVNQIPVSVSIAVDLPYPIGSGNNTEATGGNGWLNYQTWPNPDGTYVTNFCQVTYVSNVNPNGTFLTIKALSVINGGIAPIVGVTKMSWVNRSDNQNTGWNIITFGIAAGSAVTDNGDNTWSFFTDTPLVFPIGVSDFYGVQSGVTVGDCIFPAMVNGQNYLNTVLNSFNGLGPGQMTTSTDLQSLGAIRFPSSAATYPSVIDGRFINQLSVDNPEIIDAQFVNNNAIFATSTALVSGQVKLITTYGSPWYAVPPNPNAPPNIYIPANIAFYDQNTPGI